MPCAKRFVNDSVEFSVVLGDVIARTLANAGWHRVAALCYLCALAQEAVTSAGLTARTSFGDCRPGRFQSEPTGATLRLNLGQSPFSK